MIETDLDRTIAYVREREGLKGLNSPPLKEIHPQFNIISRGRVLARKGLD